LGNRPDPPPEESAFLYLVTRGDVKRKSQFQVKTCWKAIFFIPSDFRKCTAFQGTAV